MDNSPMDCNGLPTTNFDMEILTSMTNTDMLIRLIKDQAEETAILKNQLSSFNSSAMQMKNCYTLEKKKNDQIESDNRRLQSRVEALEEQISLLNNNLLNNTAIHEQKVAEMENQQALVCRHLITQRNILKANHLCTKDSHLHYSNAKEFLRKRGEIIAEDVKDVKVSNRKKKPTTVNAATMTDPCDIIEPKDVKTFCDKSTMHCPMVSTATRGTTTSVFIKKVDVATNFPEPISIDVDEIFRIMIDDMPPAITPIDDLPLKTKCSQTEPVPQSNCSVGTVTRIRNVRRRINYVSENSHPSPAPNSLYRVKKEKEDCMPADLLNLDYPIQGLSNSPINQKLTHLWQMVGQMIFAIIGNGEVFNHSTNMTLINDNLNQIRRVIEMESQPEAFAEENFDSGLNVATELSGMDISDCTSHDNATETSDSLNEQRKQSLLIDLPLEASNSQIYQNESSFTNVTINNDNSAKKMPPTTVDSSVQCETEKRFKRPTSGGKRKLPIESCIIKKRTCQRKMSVRPRASQLDETEENGFILNGSFSCEAASSIVPNEKSTELSTPIIEDSDSSLVEDILRYYRMPEFIEPIIDSKVAIEASKTFEKVEERISNSQNVVERPTESISPVPEFSDPPKLFEMESTDSSTTDSTSTDEPSTEVSICDELQSPASPPPLFDDFPSSNRSPLTIPLSPKKLNRSIVKDILANFDKRKRGAVRQRKSKILSAAEEQILTSTRCRIEKYLVSEWTANEIDACCDDLSNVRPSILAKCLVEVIMNTKNESLSQEFTPPAPSLPKTHQKIIVLIKRIGQIVNGFDDLVIFQLEKTMFVLADEKVSIAEGLNLTHLFIGLTDCMEDSSQWSCVLFVYKCLYYFAIKATPMVYTVLMAYPTILPKFQEGESVIEFLNSTNNLLQATLTIVLINTNLYEFNTGKVIGDAGLKKRDLSSFLKAYYHFPFMKPTIDDFVDILVNRLTNDSNLENVQYSLILLAKRNGSVWADEMVQRKLLPPLNRFLLTITDANSDNDQRIAILVSAISSIIKTFPVTKDVSNYQQIFYKILDLTSRQIIQEEAVMALLRTSRFGMVDVYKRICDWQPQTAVRRQCYTMLSTFLYRQNLSYWESF